MKHLLTLSLILPFVFVAPTQAQQVNVYGESYCYTNIETLWTILTLISGSLQVEICFAENFTIHQLHNDATILEDKTLTYDLLTIKI